MSDRPASDHYSYTFYADPKNARAFDERRFGGPIGGMVAGIQAKVLANMVGRIKGRPILDVGTGTGRAALLLARGGAKVTALDASAEMLAIARERAREEGLDLTFVQGDAHALRFPNRSFDVTLSLRVLMHTPRWRICIRELCRVADRLVIVDYPSARSAARGQSIVRRAAVLIGRAAEPYRVFSDREIAAAFLEEGFRVRSVHRMFVLPIAFHKAIGSRRFTHRIEGMLERAGLLNLLGSPVTIVAERCVIS